MVRASGICDEVDSRQVVFLGGHVIYMSHLPSRTSHHLLLRHPPPKQALAHSQQQTSLTQQVLRELF